MRTFALLFLSLAFATPAIAAPGVDPLTAVIDDRDAQRFAKLFRDTGGKPSAAQIQAQYLNSAGPGVVLFTPYRIESAENLASAIAKDPALYAYAIENCLPRIKGLTPSLRATYLAYRGFAPTLPLPQFHLVFGAANSGGMAKPDAQVIALEVMCGPGTTPEQFQANMRGLFAHETVHSWQREPAPDALKDMLLFMALMEGVPDFLATTVTGHYPNADRDNWGSAREAQVWADFQRDRAIIAKGTNAKGDRSPEAEKAMRRWFYNYGDAPEGWPFEAGYWVGSRIARAYFEEAADKDQAIRDLIALKDPAGILAASGYAGAAAQ